MAKTSQAQLKAAEKYLSGQRQVVIRLDREKDGDILAWLESKPSMQRYIKDLIEVDMISKSLYCIVDETGCIHPGGDGPFTHRGALRMIKAYEEDDKLDGRYEKGHYYIKNLETQYCTRIINA